MADLFITEQGSSLHKSGESILLKKDGELIHEIEFRNVDSIQIFGYINFSTQFLRKAWQYGIAISFFSMSGKLMGQLAPVLGKNVSLRVGQHNCVNDDKFALSFSRKIVTMKCRLALRFLNAASRSKKDVDKKFVDIMSGQIEKIQIADNKESLLGLEGSFARQYFRVYGQLFSNASLFKKRSKRPPRDEVNALMSFMYTLLTNRLVNHLAGAGFDPYLGMYHSMEYGRVSLALDLVEFFRSLLADRLVLKWFNLGQMNTDDFVVMKDQSRLGTLESSDSQKNEISYRLTRAGMKKFFALYHQELNVSRNYYFTNGSFIEVVQVLLSWLRQSIVHGEITDLCECK